MTIRRLIYFSDRAAGLLGTISSSTVNAAIEKAYGAPEPQQAGLAAELYPLLAEWKPKTRKEIDAKNAAATKVMAAMDGDMPK